jgi:DNA repair protein RecO (recombination protein O)
MIESATGVVLRTRPLTETSLIVHWLTSSLGRVATVAKGARGPKSPFRGKLDLFYLADISLNRSRSSELHQLREVSLLNIHARLREELGYVQQASYAAALIEQATETETPLGPVFELFESLLDYLPSRKPEPQTLFAFELRLLNELGLSPGLEESGLNAGTRLLVKTFAEAGWPIVANLRLSSSQVTELAQFLHGYLIFHLGKFPKGRRAALLL